MSIADQDVGPAIIVHIEKAAAPAEILSVRPQPRGKRRILKIPIAAIVVERWRIAGEISLHNIQVPVQIVIRGGNAHAGLGLAIGT